MKAILITFIALLCWTNLSTQEKHPQTYQQVQRAREEKAKLEKKRQLVKELKNGEEFDISDKGQGAKNTKNIKNIDQQSDAYARHVENLPNFNAASVSQKTSSLTPEQRKEIQHHVAQYSRVIDKIGSIVKQITGKTIKTETPSELPPRHSSNRLVNEHAASIKKAIEDNADTERIVSEIQKDISSENLNEDDISDLVRELANLRKQKQRLLEEKNKLNDKNKK